jgi:hypothetical protein
MDGHPGRFADASAGQDVDHWGVQTAALYQEADRGCHQLASVDAPEQGELFLRQALPRWAAFPVEADEFPVAEHFAVDARQWAGRA